MKNWKKLLLSICFVTLLFGLFTIQSTMAATQITVWVKWSGAEFKAIRDVVNAFNSSQDEVSVKLLSIGDIDTKFYTAVAGGNPPDVIHVMSHQVVSWADKNALQSLEDLPEYGVDLSLYVNRYIELGKYNEKLYAVPITPGIVFLYWNKKLFKEAGLDPNKPPKTIDELNQYNKKLTKYDDKGELTQMGFDPIGQGWWPPAWCYFFGGQLIEPKTGKITANNPQNVKAYEWVKNLVAEFGEPKFKKFRAGFGQYWSSQNSFISGKVATAYDGIWNAHLIHQFAPDLDWGVAPFPSVDGKKRIYIEGDYLSIPTAARYPKEAKKFLAYLMKPENLEQINVGQWKIPALKKLSDNFYTNHPNKRIKEFVEIGEKADELFSWPRITFWNFYLSQWWDEVVPKVTSLTQSPKEAIDEMQKKVEEENNKYKKKE